MRARDYGVAPGYLEPGPRNKISDVPGVTVGHATLIGNGRNTGVTVILPTIDNPFVYKLPAAAFVANGFGKTQGLVQIDELGTLETPIALTNTLNVGRVHDALTEYMIARCKRENVPLRSINPVVCECNDAALNDIQRRAVHAEHVFSAIASASQDFEEGAVGAGRGLTCHGLKGGIGSASRRLQFGGNIYTIGLLVQANHGRLSDLLIEGKPIGREIARKLHEDQPDKGSCICILATDLPLSDRQLKRAIRRCSVGLIRLGSYIGHGSGEIFIGFSTANRTAPDQDFRDIIPASYLNESRMDDVFRAVAECAEEAVLNALFTAETVRAENGTVRHGLSSFYKS